MQSADSGVYSARAYRAAETSGCWRDRAESNADLSDTTQSFHSPPWHVHAGMHALARQIFNTYLNIVQSHTQPHIPSPHRRSVSLFLRLTFSHCSKALCHWGTSGVRVWFPLWSLLTNRTVTAEAEVLLPVHQEYFCLKPETLKYWFVLLACFKAGQFDIYNTWCWIPKRLLVGSIRETLYYHCSRFRSFLLYTNLHDSHLKT